MTLPHYTLRPTVRAALLAFLVHHNPFYLLSALCMVSACFALNSGLAPHAGELPKLLALLGALNVYEALLIALGLYLIRRRGVIRDGRTLLLIEAPFLFDFMFLNAEAGSVDLGHGITVGAAVFVLALLKCAVVLRILCGRWPGKTVAFVALSLGAVFLLPAGFKWIERRGPVTGIHFHLAWWGVGCLLAFREAQRRLWPETEQDAGVARTIRRLYSILPVISLVAHIGMLHWVYLVAFSPADLSPVLLGAALAAGASRFVLPLRVALPALAAAMALGEPLPYHAPLLGRLALTPALVTAGAAYLVYVYCFFLSRAVFLVGAAAVVGATVAVGPTLAQITAAAEAAWRSARALVESRLPRTAYQWGLTAMAASFGFLGIGAALSLRGRAGPVAEAAGTREVKQDVSVLPPPDDFMDIA